MQAWIIAIMNQFGYLGTFFLITIENLFPPIPSEVILSIGGYFTTIAGSKTTIGGIVTAATIGSVFGALILYKIGTLISVEKLNTWLDDKRVKRLGFKKTEVMKATAIFERYQSWSVFVGRCIPIIRSLISIPAGMTEMPLVKFLGFSTLGSLIWNLLLVNLGALAGSKWPIIVHYVGLYQNLIIAIIALATILYLIKFIRNRLKQNH